METIPERTTRLSTTEYAVLGLLTAGERSGYDLMKKAQESVGYVWTPAKSQIYAVLPRLVAGGWAARRDVAQQQRPDKQVYRITKAGRRALRAWLEEPVEYRDGDRNPFELKVFFGGLMGREALVAHIERHRARAEADLAEYRAIERRIGGRDDKYYAYLTLRWGLARARAQIRWANEVLHQLDTRREEDST